VNNFADRLVAAIKAKGTPCIVGLDPRIDRMPAFVQRAGTTSAAQVGESIAAFNRVMLDAIRRLVPAVKLQMAFYEQYGLSGLQAFVDTIEVAKAAGLIVIVDGKRNDISSTAEAYARAYLSSTADCPGSFDVDALTVSPFLGRDSLRPFVEASLHFGKGIFVLVKTSNHGSADIQDQRLLGGERLYERLASFVEELGRDVLGTEGYSSIGAVVGATFPAEAVLLRRLMPHAMILVPGYGAQGGTAHDAVAAFNEDGYGAIVSASRSVTYPHEDSDIDVSSFIALVRRSTMKMIEDVNGALRDGAKSAGSGT